MDVTELIDRYCSVWNEPDPSVRADRLASPWANDATCTDPMVHAAYARELLAHIAAVRTRRPGATVLRTSAVDAHHRSDAVEWP